MEISKTNKQKESNTSHPKLNHDSKFGNTNNSNSLDVNKMICHFKIIILGSISVGKTSIIGRFVGNQFSSKYKCSISVDMRMKSMQIDQSTVADLKIWDTCGDEKYHSISRQYYNQANGVILVFDITDKKSFEQLDKWLGDVRNCVPKNTVIIIVGNKSDLESNRVVPMSDIEGYTKMRDLEYIEVSAKTGTNIHLLFEKMANKLVKVHNAKGDSIYEPEKNAIKLNEEKEEQRSAKTGCC